MPGIIDHPVSAKLSRMIGDTLTIANNHDPFRTGPDCRRASGKSAVNAVMVAVIADQAGARDPAFGIDMSMKRSGDRNQVLSLLGKDFRDGPGRILRVLSFPANRQALIRQPIVQLRQAREPRAGRE